MKAKNKVLAVTVALVAVISAGVFAACSPLANAKDAPEATQEETALVEEATDKAAEPTEAAAEDEKAVVEDEAEVEEASDEEAPAPAATEDLYMATYNSGDTDCLITVHKEAGLSCMDCHDNDTVASSASFTELTAPSEDTLATREFCLNEGCHNWDDIVDTTILDGDQTVYDPEGTYNVHDNHRGDVDCGQCHSMHAQPTLNCVYCHYMDLPEGWDGFK